MIQGEWGLNWALLWFKLQWFNVKGFARPPKTCSNYGEIWVMEF